MTPILSLIYRSRARCATASTGFPIGRSEQSSSCRERPHPAGARNPKLRLNMSGFLTPPCPCGCEAGPSNSLFFLKLSGIRGTWCYISGVGILYNLVQISIFPHRVNLALCGCLRLGTEDA
jgi:hypothetical protein